METFNRWGQNLSLLGAILHIGLGNPSEAAMLTGLAAFFNVERLHDRLDKGGRP